MTALLVILALALIAAGTAGIVYPALPGLALMFAGTWLLAYSGGYQIYGAGVLWTVGLISLAGIIMDYISGLLGTKYTGAGKLAVRGAFIGSIIGMFFSLPGLILGPFIGAAAGELIDRRNMLQAGKAGWGALLGLLIGTAFKIGCAVSILFILLVKYIAYLF
ncbi:TPA: DUF456 domain-containing protein [Neisseria meningitidis]